MYRRLAVPAAADILICAGDACEGFSPSDMQDFFDWYLSKPAALRIFVHVHQEGLKRKAAPGGTAYLNVSYFESLRRGMY